MKGIKKLISGLLFTAIVFTTANISFAEQIDDDFESVHINAADACMIDCNNGTYNNHTDYSVAQKPLITKYNLEDISLADVKEAKLKIKCAQNSTGNDNIKLFFYKMAADNWNGETLTYDEYVAIGNNPWAGDGYKWIEGVSSPNGGYLEYDVTEYLQEGMKEISFMTLANYNSYKFGNPMSETEPAYLDLKCNTIITQKTNAADACMIDCNDGTYNNHTDYSVAQKALITKYNLEGISLSGLKEAKLKLRCAWNSTGSDNVNLFFYKMDANNWNGETLTYNEYVSIGNNAWGGTGYKWIMDIYSPAGAYMECDVTEYLKEGIKEISFMTCVNSNSYKFDNPMSADNSAYLELKLDSRKTEQVYSGGKCLISHAESEETYNKHNESVAGQYGKDLILKYDLTNTDLSALESAVINLKCTYTPMDSYSVWVRRLNTNSWKEDTFNWNEYLKTDTAPWLSYNNGESKQDIVIHGVSAATGQYSQLDVTDILQSYISESAAKVNTVSFMISTGGYFQLESLENGNYAPLTLKFGGENAIAQDRVKILKKISQYDAADAIEVMKSHRATFGIENDEKASAYAVAINKENIKSLASAKNEYFSKADKGGFMLTQFADNSVNTAAVIKNLSKDSSAAPIVIFAGYDEEGKLINVKYGNGAENVAGYNFETYSADSLKCEGMVKEKAFAIDNLTTLVPVDECIEMDLR